MADPPAGGGAGIEASLQQTLRVISSVVAPTSVLVATLYYFGWVSTSVQANYFRFDASLLGFSTQDYLLQSISPVFLPLGAALLVVMLLLQCHTFVAKRAGSDRTGRIVTAVLTVTGVALFTVGVVGILRPRRVVDLMTPLGFAGGTGTLAYVMHLRRSRRSAASSQAGGTPMIRSGLSLSTLALSVLVGLCLVWVVAEYAEWDGLRKAERLTYNLPSKAGVVVYAKTRLLLHGPGVQEQVLSEPDIDYPFRYDGLRLLVHSKGKFFLLPSGWSTQDGVLFVLRDGEDLRFEFTTS